MHLCIGPRATNMPLDRKRAFAGGYLRLSMTAENRPAQHSRTLPGSTPGGIGAGLATRQGCPIAAHAVGARGGQDQRGNKPARSSYTTIHAACRSITDSVSLVLTLPVSPVLLATRVLVVSVRGSVVPVFPVLPVVAHLAVFLRWLERDRW